MSLNNVNVKISYTGRYPNLCSGKLVVVIEGSKKSEWDKEWIFPDYCLSSGGGVSFDEHWSEHVSSGAWSVKEDSWPKSFPKSLKAIVLEAINNKIPQGCCGGCV